MTDDPTKPDLSLVDTEWMVQEIMRRNDATIIVRECKPDGEHAETFYDYDGGLSTCLGLAMRLERRLLDSAAEAAAENTDGD